MTQMSQAVEEYGGTVQAYQGDGICAYFGVPVTHEDDPERAARSALRIQEVVGDYARDIAEAWAIPDFAVRVGINTGRVSVGRVGAGSPQIAAFGDAVKSRPTSRRGGSRNDRRRRRDGATPRAPVHDRAAGTQCGSVGRTQPIGASRLVGPHACPSPAATRAHSSAATPRSHACGPSRPTSRPVAVRRSCSSGEPGIGKTRMLAELRSIAARPSDVARGSLSLVRRLGRSSTCSGAGSASSPGTRRSSCARAPGQDSARSSVGIRWRALPGLARLMRIDPSRTRAARARRTRAVTTSRGSTALTEQGPVVVAIEDLHWAHASTRELAEDLLALTDRVPAAPRRDAAARHRLGGLAVPHARARPTSRTARPRSRSTRFLRRRRARSSPTLLPGALDETTGDEIVARAEGNPLYLEELLRALLEGGGLERRHRTWTTNLTPSSLLPPALENLLVARIDRLADGPRRLAQIAAVLGREFPVTSPRARRGGGRGRGPRGASPRRDRARATALPRARRARSGTGCCRRRRSRRSPPPDVASCTPPSRPPSSSSTPERWTTTSNDSPTTTRRAETPPGRPCTSSERRRERTSSAPDARASELRERARELAVDGDS